MKIPVDTHKAWKIAFEAMKDKRRPLWPIWRELAQVYLPYTHPWLLNVKKSEKFSLNPNYITSEGLIALRTQTAGLMNGITSPTRPWFKLQIGHDLDRLSVSARQWLTSVERIMHGVLARSNFYNTMSMSYFDLGLFNISGTQIFEDRRDVIRCQRFNTGEFYVAYDYLDRLVRYGREISMSLEEIRKEFGEENMPAMWREQYKNPASRSSKRTVIHMVERKDATPETMPISNRFEWREVYWGEGQEEGTVMKLKGYREQPAMFPRWSAELQYGNAPAMDALADMRELQQLLIKKGVGLEKLIDPPMLFDAQLRNMPKSTMPGGHTYVPNLANFTGAKPAFQVQIPVQELREDINEIKLSIREIFHNDLFKMISQLDTVRSATEIDARREEKLVLLAHFLERFENEQLDPTIERTFNICQRADLFPLPPSDIRESDIDVSYVSILTTAQRAIGTVPLERVLAMVGNVAAVEPSVLDIVNFDEFVYTYSRDIGASPTILRDAEQLKQARAAREEQLAQLQASQTAETAIQAGKTLSETDVGGGANALQRVLGQ